jgi:uncharacterized membrane protein YheB (UPF0754 family)
MFDYPGPIVFAIPVVAGFIGWLTNWLAVKALLYPVEFKGIPPLLGWQGVMPRNAEEMSLSFSKLIREKLIDIEQLFSELKHDDNQELDKLVEKVSNQVIEEFSTNIAPDKWARARDKLREYINNLVRKNVREMIQEMMDRMGHEAQDIIDIDGMMSTSMAEDRALMGEILCEIAAPEFRFIEMSGLYFGLLFGVIQMFVWMFYPAYWVLPAAGFVVGYATNWMALHLIFEPREPRKLGPFTLQGVFIKRQYEVAVKFADVVCDKVLNAKNMIRHMNQQPARAAIMAIIDEQVDGSMAMYEKDAMVGMLVSKEKLAEAKVDLKRRIDRADLENDGPLQSFADQSPRIREQIIISLRELDSAEFSGVLRPVFQKDEWKLLLAGGVIGVVIGALQYVWLFDGSFY